MAPYRKIRHLTFRFFDVLVASPLTPREQDLVNNVLTSDQAVLFWEQDPIDQRHAFQVAHRVEERLGHAVAPIAAALLHDVGKRHSDVGPIGRSLATVLDTLHLPIPDAWHRYRDHEALGAADLELIGADPLVVAFARGSSVCPDSIDPTVWDVLVAADDA